MLKEMGCWNCDKQETCEDYYWSKVKCWMWSLASHEKTKIVNDASNSCMNCAYKQSCKLSGTYRATGKCSSWKLNEK